MKKTRQEIRAAYLFLLPSLVGILLFNLGPQIFSLFVSLTDWNFLDGIGNWNFVGLENFIALWKDEWFLAALKNTIVYTVVTVPVSIFLSLALAVIIDDFIHAKVAGVVRIAMYMPNICNIVATSAIWIAFYSRYGPFTNLMRLLGWADPPRWLADYFWALPAVMLVSVWGGLGYRVFLYSASLQSLSRELYEAAEIDGAGRAQKFFRITVPLLRPTTFFLFITGIIGSFQVFGSVNVMTRGGPGHATYTLVYYIFTNAFSYYRMGYGSAVAVYLFIILLALTVYRWRRDQRADEN